MYQLQSEVVVYGDLDILLGAQVPLRCLDGGVPKQKLDLLEIAAVLAAELGAGAAEVVGAEVLDSRFVWMTVQLPTTPPSRSGCRG